MCSTLAWTRLMHWVACSHPACVIVGRHIGSGPTRWLPWKPSIIPRQFPEMAIDRTLLYHTYFCSKYALQGHFCGHCWGIPHVVIVGTFTPCGHCRAIYSMWSLLGHLLLVFTFGEIFTPCVRCWDIHSMCSLLGHLRHVLTTGTFTPCAHHWDIYAMCSPLGHLRHVLTTGTFMLYAHC